MSISKEQYKEIRDIVINGTCHLSDSDFEQVKLVLRLIRHNAIKEKVITDLGDIDASDCPKTY